MQILKCTNCGEPLSEVDGHLHCRFCGATYDRADEALKLEEMLEAHKQSALANRRRLLWQATHEENPSAEAIVAAARSVLEIQEQDALANFYVAIHQKDASLVNQFFVKSKLDPAAAKEIMRFALLSIDPRNVTALKTFAEHHFSGKDYTQYVTKIEEEVGKIEDGVYMTSLPRDVFLAYSSADMDQVVDMLNYLEKEGQFEVFCAVRNLRHGKGARENYEEAIKDAMNHCKTFVFLSSKNSRSLSCDALSMEIPYLMDHLPNMPRIHYRLDDDGETRVGVKIVLKDFDDGHEWCRDKEDLIERILKAKKPPVKKEEPAPEPAPAPKQRSSEQLLLTKTDPDLVFSGDTILEYKGPASDILISDEFRKIERGAFKQAPNLVKLDTGETVETLSAFAIDGCEHLRTFVVGEGLIEIGEGAFARVPELEEIVMGEGANMAFDVIDGALYDEDCEVLYRYPPKARGKIFKVDKHCTTIDVGAFSGCDNLEEVVLPDGLNVIRNGAFAKCLRLKKVFIPYSVEEMGKNVFAGCNSVTIQCERSSYPRNGNPAFSGGMLVKYGAKR